MVDVFEATYWVRFLVAGVLLLAVGGCATEETGHQLRVDLITDFLPASEFDAVRVSIGLGDVRENFAHVVDPSRDYVRGVALGDIRVPPSEQAIEVSLFQDGAPVIARQVSVIVQSAVTVATVVITRDCRGVMCPGLGNPLLASCLGGQCADPRCTVETPEFCPEGTCFADADCPMHACARATCITGACLFDPDDSMCESGQRCDVELECVEGDLDAGAQDAGMPDARTPDAFTQPDAGPVEMDVPVVDVFDAGPPPGCSGPDPDTLFLYDFSGDLDLVSGYAGATRSGGALAPGDSPCDPQVLMTPSPLASRFVVPDQASFRVAEGSLDFWVRRPSSLTGSAVGVFSRDEIDIDTEGQLTLFLSLEERFVLRGQINDSLSVRLCSTGPVPSEEWVRVGINWGADGLELYLNGVLQLGTGTVGIFSENDAGCSESTIPFSIAGTQNPFVLGASIHRSAPGVDEPTAHPGPDWQYSHFRLSSVRRDYATEL